MDSTITCPKCGREQHVSEQCVSCEIYFEKYNQAQQDAPAGELQPGSEPASPRERDQSSDEQGLNPMAIGAGIVVAIAGAWLWQWIAVTFEYEFGFIAWGIGIAIGFAVAMTDGKGLASGVFCAVLAGAAIIGGKYWTVESYRADAMELMTVADSSESRMLFEELQEDARLYAQIDKDEASLRQFMDERNYDWDGSALISAEEVEAFRQYSAPELEWIQTSDPTYDQWIESSQQQLAGFSAWDLVIEDFGLFTLLFMALGIGTAFKLGMGGED